jgi:hypothetical protein
MASSTVPSIEATLSTTIRVKSNGAMNMDESLEEDDGEWEDVTELLATATSQLRVGEMVHPEDFSLYSAMSAIELMQPKMDVGFGLVRNVEEVEIPSTLSDAEVIRIMDELLACQATWMEAHTLPQTVCSCVYTQRLDEVPRPELSAFIRIQLACMSLVRTIVSTEQVADEEDFILYNFGFNLPVLSEPTVAKLVRDATSAEKTGAPSGCSGSRATAALRQLLCARLKFLQLFHSAISALTSPKCKRIPEAEIAIELAVAQLKLIETSSSQFPDGVIADCFDSTFNRHLLSNAPPRTAPLLARPLAFASWSKLLDQLRVLTILRNRVLPEARRRRTRRSSDDQVANPPTEIPDEYIPFYSFHTLCHGLTEFSALWNPCIVTRSLLKRMLLPSLRDPTRVYSMKDAPLANLLLADIGLTRDSANEKLRKQADDLVPAAAHILRSLLRNRGRQRRCLLQSLTEWDRSVFLFTSESSSHMASTAVDDADSTDASASQEEDSLESSLRKAGPSRARDMLAGKAPLQLFGHEVLTRIMMQHWLLGFECNLYSPREYAPIYFYVGYVMTTAANATAALANAGLQNAELHPCRYALYLLDEARLWLCRGTFSLLEALELEPHWNYSWRRRQRRWVPSQAVDETLNGFPNGSDPIQGIFETTPDDDDDEAVFESEALWYQQRFGMMNRLRTGPQYMNYRTFLSLMNLQRDALLEKGPPESDEIDVRLADASGGFKMVRDSLKRARAVADGIGWEPILKEALDLSRVAVSNTVLIARLQKARAAKPSPDASETSAKVEITFSFNAHRHFPVVEIV